MRARSARLILAALAMLVAIYLATRLVARRGERLDTGGLDVGAALDSATSLVRIRRPEGDSVQLERTGGEWRVNGWPADTAEVGAALAALDTARAREIVSRSAENHDRLGVTEQAAARLEIGPADSPTLILLIGHAGRGGRYVRTPESAEVRLLPGNAGQLLVRDADAWRDRLVAALDTTRVREVVVRRDGDRVVLTRTEGKWTAGGAPADTARVSDLLGALSRLIALRFPPDSVVLRADFEHPDATVEAYEEPDGAASGAAPLAALLLVREEGGNYLVRRADRPDAYLVAGWAAERLLPASEDVRP